MSKLRSLPIVNLIPILGRKIIQSKSIWIFFGFFLVFAYQFSRHFVYVQSEPITVWTNPVTADCAVVLTGGSGRIREGFDLLSQKSIKKLIVSGVNATSSLTEIFPLWVFYSEIREEDVFLERRSETTYGNAQQSLSLVEALNCRDVVLITSHLHMYRAFKTFRNVFPTQIELIKQSLPTSRRVRFVVWESAIEAVKSLFYSYWAYEP